MKHIITLIVAASAVIHARAADLASQLPGYWQPDMEKTLALAKKANREMDPLSQAMMGKMVFEFQKDKMIVHGPPGNLAENPPVPFTVKGVDQAANTLTLSAGGKEMKVRFNNGQMALNDPKTGWMILNRMSKEDFDKRKPAGAKIEAEGGDKAPAAGKLKDISAQPIPDKPAAGKVHGREFKVEKATLKQGRLDLWQGGDTAPHLEKFGIQISQKEVGDLSGQTFTVKLSEDTGIVIVLSYSGENKEPMMNRFFMSEQYTMKLEFGTAKDGKIPGKIHLRLLDEAGSFVVGTFEAEIK